MTHAIAILNKERNRLEHEIRFKKMKEVNVTSYERDLAETNQCINYLLENSPKIINQ